MDARLKPIPAFYCCYLLRSTVRPSSVYVGSSPNPSRRLAQHNGKVKGGAVRTSKLNLRPWEMVCIVAGFPSNIAALQFEWAWQNAHLTRHITQEQRISFSTTRVTTNSKTGKTRRKPGRPRTSIIDKLANLHLLLCTPYFSKWPLELRFFNQETHQLWQSWCERTDGQIRNGIKVLLDLPQSLSEDEEFSSAQRPSKRRKIDFIGKGGVEGIDPTYAKYKDVLEKGETFPDATAFQPCDICLSGVDIPNDLFTICPNLQCRSIAHVSCLSNKFLEDSRLMQMIPESGRCPSCQSSLSWIDLMRALTLRTRGEQQVRKLLSKKQKGRVVVAADILEDSDEEDSDESMDEGEAVDMVDNDVGDTDGGVSVTSMDSIDSLQPSQSVTSKHRQERLEIVIEDSEDDR